jgi:transcription initiation factor IIF auxiliary subunit
MSNSSVIITKPIVYGSIAFWLGKKAEESISHKWCVYVRGVNNEDISYFVKDVTFTLHSSFEQNVRTVSKWPFELYEGGWGEFDIKITIQLIDEAIKPIEFVHSLKLYPTQQHVSLSIKKPIVSETYDEIIFVNPNHRLLEILNFVPAHREPSNIVQMNVDDDEYYIEDKKSNHGGIDKDIEMMKVDDEVNNLEEDKNETISMSMFSQKNDVNTILYRIPILTIYQIFSNTICL